MNSHFIVSCHLGHSSPLIYKMVQALSLYNLPDFKVQNIATLHVTQGGLMRQSFLYAHYMQSYSIICLYMTYFKFIVLIWCVTAYYVIFGFYMLMAKVISMITRGNKQKRSQQLEGIFLLQIYSFALFVCLLLLLLLFSVCHVIFLLYG